MFKKFIKILIPTGIIKRLQILREKIEVNRFKNLGLEDVFKQYTKRKSGHLKVKRKILNTTQV